MNFNLLPSLGPTYAGVTLTKATPEINALVERYVSLRDILQFPAAGFLYTLRTYMPYPDQMDRPIKLESLWWPQGATRWATGHFLATEKQLAAIRAALRYDSPDFVLNPAELILEDGTATLATDLWMLPPRPLFQPPLNPLQSATNSTMPLTKWLLPITYNDFPQDFIGTSTEPPGEQLYLITLVDDRFFWWQKTSQIAINVGVTTWDDLLQQIENTIGDTLVRDAIAAAYGKPTNSFVPFQRFAPLILDQAAFAIGQRVVRSLDGAVALQNATTAITSQNDQLAAGLCPVMGGGLFGFDLGPTNASDLPPIVPAALDVVFPAAGVELPEVIHVTLASLSLTQFDLVKSVNSSATGIVPSTIAKTAGFDLSLMATEIARDWYLYQLAKVDMTFAGLCLWTPEGGSDAIEWVHGLDRGEQPIVSTRVSKGFGAVHGILPPVIHGGGLDFNSFRNLYKSWYGMPVTGQDIGPGVAMPPNTIAAVFFPSPRSVHLARLGIFIANPGATGATFRLGIYDIQDPEHIDPRNRVVDGGALVVDTDTLGNAPYNGFVSNTINFTTAANTAYWLVIRGNDLTDDIGLLATSVTINFVSQVMEYAILGRNDDGTGAAAFWYLATLDPTEHPFASDALPATAAEWLDGAGTSLAIRGDHAPDVVVKGA